MFMDFREQQEGESDFAYAARILHAAGTSFEAMLANGSFSLAELRTLKERIELLVATKIDAMLDTGRVTAVVDTKTRKN